MAKASEVTAGQIIHHVPLLQYCCAEMFVSDFDRFSFFSSFWFFGQTYSSLESVFGRVIVVIEA